MRTELDLRRLLARIDGRGYKAYRDIAGCFDFADYSLSIDYVQGDPFASPSRFRVQIPHQRAGFPSYLFSSRIRRIGFQDYLARAFRGAIRRFAKQRRGTGHSGLFQVDAGGQEVLERSSICLGTQRLEARFFVGLPASGRRVLARQAVEMIFGEVPRIACSSLLYEHHSEKDIRDHVEVVEDQEHMRKQLSEEGLVAFLANGSILPRRSGVDDRPLEKGADRVVVPFESPPDLEVELDCPNSGKIRGLGIPRGVTLVVGGGYHGKSTLLRAIERGVYNHVPGDGRERTVTLTSATKIRAEDGRYVEKVDISPFISNLPYGRDTACFSTENASGSTSQAANIIEALEVGAELLLIDEDTSATNFIIRDARMQVLVEKSKEPITPFLDQVRALYNDHGTSTILVMGGSGDYFDVADQVIMMDEYHPRAVTERAKQIVREFPSRREAEGKLGFGALRGRHPDPSSFDPSRGRREVKVDAKGLKMILFGSTLIDLSSLEQLVDVSQTRSIARAILMFANRYAPRDLSLCEGLELLESELELKGLDALTPFKVGNLARPRMQEVAFAINRLRTLRIRQ
jgi:predicted ABC-class ATPase